MNFNKFIIYYYDYYFLIKNYYKLLALIATVSSLIKYNNIFLKN